MEFGKKSQLPTFVMPANAGIHGGERRNWRSGAPARAKALDPSRARAKALDPRFRGDDRRCVERFRASSLAEKITRCAGFGRSGGSPERVRIKAGGVAVFGAIEIKLRLNSPFCKHFHRPRSNVRKTGSRSYRGRQSAFARI